MTTVAISQPFYFPWVGFFAMLRLADRLVWLDDAQFSKGSFVNRVQVKTAQGSKWMTVPLEKGGSFRPIRELEATGAAWREAHRALLEQSLKDQPHREEALAVFDRGVAARGLPDLLQAGCSTLAEAIGLPVPEAAVSSEMGIAGRGSARVLEIVRALGGTRYVTGHGAKRYLDHAEFEQNGVTVEYMDYAPHPWPQAHGAFTPFVTALDLVAAVAPEQRAAHLNPRTIPWREALEDT